MIGDNGAAAQSYRLTVTRFWDDPYTPCEHWYNAKTGAHCGHLLDQTTEEGAR